MRREEAFITRDGKVFLSPREARAHAEELYGSRLMKLGHELQAAFTYGDASRAKNLADWMEANAERLFAELSEIIADKRDRNLPPREED